MWLPDCGNWCKSCCSWVFLAGISLSVSTSECFEFASLQLLRFLPFSPLLFPSIFLFLFYCRAHQCYPKLKVYTRTVGILVSLSTDFLWILNGVYSHSNVYSRISWWCSNRYYTINQGTEKHSDINLKLLHILRKPLTLKPVFYTINQGTRKRRDTTLIREIKRYHFQM